MDELPLFGDSAPDLRARARILAFDVDDAAQAHQRLLASGIYVDRRDRRLRFGFGVYHDEAAVDRLLEAASRALG